jgi:hypothetical protein
VTIHDGSAVRTDDCALPHAEAGLRRLDCLAPAAALWVITASDLALAGACVAVLGALLLTGLLGLLAFAALGELMDAYALPGRPHRIVVTTAMLRSLGPAEREALFAHERAHNRAGHHYFLAVAELTAHCHPALRRVRETVRLAAERDADEAAATAVGDRRLIATAIARAALAGHASPTTRPDFAPAATTGPVSQRVAALLGPARKRPRATRTTAFFLVVCTLLSVAAGTAGVVDFHHEVEVAQGEVTP